MDLTDGADYNGFIPANPLHRLNPCSCVFLWPVNSRAMSDKLIFKIHRILGLAGGLFIMLLAVTGIIMLLDDQLTAWLNPTLATVTPQQQHQPVDSSLAAVRQQFPAASLINLRLATEPTQALQAEIQEGRVRKRVYINPYTSRVLGATEYESLLGRRARQLHENLLLPPVGGYIMGLVGICLLGSVLTGTWYYRRSLRSVFTIGVRWRKSQRIVYADLHKWLGVVGLLFMTLMSGTGIFFHWEEVADVFDAQPSPKQEVAAPVVGSVDTALRQSKAAIAGFIPEFIQFPVSIDTPLFIGGNVPGANRLFGRLTHSTQFDARSGKLTSVFSTSNADLEYKAEHLFEELHFGRFGGWISKSIWILFALATIIVTFSGLILWWIKRN